MKKTLKLASWLALASLALSAQAGTVQTELTLRYDALGGNEVIGGMALDAGQSLVVTGYANYGPSGTGLLQYFTAKYDSYGRLQWRRNYSTGTASYITPNSNLALDRNGNVFVVLSESYNFGQILKYDAAGNMTLFAAGQSVPFNWDQSFGLRTDAAGNVYLRAANYLDKYAPNGARLWRQQFQPYFANWVRDIQVDAAGNVYAVGYGSAAAGATYADTVVAKFDSATGARLWTRTADNGFTDRGIEASFNAAGQLVVLGSKGSATLGSVATQVLTYNPDGTPVGNFAYSHGTVHQPVAMKVGEDNSITVTSTVDADIHTARYSAAGALLWAARYTNAFTDQARAVDVDPLGNTVVVGEAPNGSHWSNGQIVTLKYNASGVQQFAKRDVAGFGSHVKLGPTGDVYVGAYTYYPFDALVLRYREFNGVCP